MRMLPASLSARLLIAMFGSIFAAQLVGSVVFLYDHQIQTARWSAIGWSVRVIDLVRMLDTMDAPARTLALQAIADKNTDKEQPSARPTSQNADAEFMRSFRQRVAQLRSSNNAIAIGPSQAGFAPDIELDTLPELPAVGKPLFYDVRVPFADGASLKLRLRVIDRAVPLAYHIYLFPLALMAALFLGTWGISRGVTVPLSRLSTAADALGRGLPQQPLVEEGPRELRRAAHAFNSMQDRLRRYLDSRTRVVAAMSHDLRTPITRMMLRVEAVSDPTVQLKLTQDLEEMQQMVHGALDMLQGLQSSEPIRPINVDALLLALRDDYQDLGFSVTVSGSLREPLAARPQAWRRLLTNLLDNCRKFASRAWLEVEERAQDVIFRVKDDGPGIPEELLERVLEPYYRVEGSRGKATGGIGLGLSIARDIAQAHGGDLRLRNLVGGGLEATVSVPRGGRHTLQQVVTTAS
jgi:signal transduction histidine kinase